MGKLSRRRHARYVSILLALLSLCQSERERLCHRACGGGGAPRAADTVDQFHEPAIKLGVGERAKKSRDQF